MMNQAEIELFHNFDIHLSTRTLYVGSVNLDDNNEDVGINAHLVDRVIKNLHILDNDAPKGDKRINIMLNNVGGDMFHTLALFDAIKACSNPVHIAVVGQAMSAAAILVQAADKRFMTPNSRMMIHYGEFTFNGIAQDAYRWTEQNKENDKLMENIFLEKIQVKHPEYTVDDIRKLCAYDKFLSAKEALELGLIDEILGD